MKKRISLILLSVIVIFFSCRDDSRQFEEQLFTNMQITNALRECMTLSIDSTRCTLCVVDTISEEYGYYWYDLQTYRIELPASAQQIIDTLTEHGFEIENTIDSLVKNINRAAEQCEKMVQSYWEPIIKNISFPNPNQTLHGGNNAITNEVKLQYQTDFINTFKTYTLNEQFNALGVTASWNNLQEEYYKITGTYIPIDILDSSVQEMVGGFFKLMALWEEKVRTDPELRGKKDGWLYLVFDTL